LWCIRLYKTRSLASNAVKQGQVKLAGANIKPSRDIYPTDILNVRKNQINYVIEVLDIPPSRVGAKLVDLYRLDKTPKEAFEKLDLLKYSKDYYRKKGVGRPTKKDRRDIDDWFTPNTNEEE